MRKKKYQLGGRESQIANTNQNLLRQDSDPKNIWKDVGNILLDTAISPIDGVLGTDLYNPTYQTKGFDIASKITNPLGKIGGKLGMAALTGGASEIGGALGASMLPKDLMFRQGGELTDINGPSHEMGGMSITPNAEAEGGETKIDDYIFSDFLKPQGSKQTFASKSKSIRNKFKLRPADKFSMEAQDNELKALIDEQESIRQQMQAEKMQEAQAIVNPDFNAMGDMVEMRTGGKIHINPKNKGKFTSWAKSHGMGVQEAARHVMANKEKYSPTIVKRANFAKNASKFKHELGGPIDPSADGKLLMQELWQPGEGLDFFDENLTQSNLPPAPIVPQTLGNTGEVELQNNFMNTTVPTNTEDVFTGNTSLLPLGTNIAGNIAKSAMLLNSNKGRLTPNVKLNTMNPQAALDIAQQQSNNALATGFKGLRDNAISSGQFVGNANTMASSAGANTGALMADIQQKYDIGNLGITNEQAIRNNDITTANNLILDQAEANRINQMAGIIDNTIGGVQQYGKDLQTQQYQDTAMNNLLPQGSKITYVRNKKGKLVPKVVANNQYLYNTIGMLQQP